MTGTRVKEVGIRGIRSLVDVTLPLDGLKVLIGENGTGKSSILESLEILRRACHPAFLHDLNTIHGGLFGLGATAGFELSVVVEKEPVAWRYQIRVGAVGGAAVIGEERLALTTHPQDLLLERRGDKCTFKHQGADNSLVVALDQPALAVLGLTKPESGVGHVYSALQGFDVQVPFEVTPRWIGLAHNRHHELRRSVQFLPAKRLQRLGSNLPNVFSALRNQPNWDETMDLVRMGLGLDVELVLVDADPGGGAAALSLKLASRDTPIPAVGLSEGMLAYLCFVGLRQLSRPDRSLLAFDEPDLHLHPGLLVRVVEFFSALADHHPVVLVTHSDRLLDSLPEPTDSVVVCELDEARNTRLRTLHADALAEWLADYRGIGALRGAGYLESVVAASQPRDAGD